MFIHWCSIAAKGKALNVGCELLQVCQNVRSLVFPFSFLQGNNIIQYFLMSWRGLGELNWKLRLDEPRQTGIHLGCSTRVPSF